MSIANPDKDHFPHGMRIFIRSSSPDDADINPRMSSDVDVEVLKARVKERLSTKKMSPRAASLAASNQPDMIRKLFRNNAIPSAIRLNKLAEVLDTSSDYMLGKTNDDSRPPEPARRILPILTYATAGRAGAAEMHPGNTTERTLTADIAVGKNSFGLHIEDDSMTAVTGQESFRVGDIIVIDPEVTPLPGKFVLARMNDEALATLRQYHIRKDRASGQEFIELVPLNPAWPTLTIDWNHPGDIIGTVVEHRHSFVRDPRIRAA